MSSKKAIRPNYQTNFSANTTKKKKKKKKEKEEQVTKKPNNKRKKISEEQLNYLRHKYFSNYNTPVTNISTSNDSAHTNIGALSAYGPLAKKAINPPKANKPAQTNTNYNKQQDQFDLKKHIPNQKVNTNILIDDSINFQKEYDYLLKHNTQKENDEFPTIGLDFGTSFTKIAFFNTEIDKGIIPFGDLSMKASVIYTNANKTKLSLFKTEETPNQIRYFKATVMQLEDYKILSDLKSSSCYNFSFIASVFFVANIIKYAQIKIASYLNTNVNYYQVNMGIPTLIDKQITETYRKILHCAVTILANYNYTDIRVLNLGTLQLWIKKALVDYNSDYYIPNNGQHATFPELFAEALYLLERKDYGPAFYSIVDIGGGTTDYLFLTKYSSRFNPSSAYTCFYAAVKPIGNEIRKKINKNIYDNYFISTFNQMIMEGKYFSDEMGIIKTLLFGGGTYAENNYYTKLINKNNLSRTQTSFSVKIEPFECDDINFIDEYKIKNEQDKSPIRFITAFRLACNAIRDDVKLQMLEVKHIAEASFSTKEDYINRQREKAGYEDIN